MRRYVVLLRGVNVGGRNAVPMADLQRHLEEQGFAGVATYIQSGNVVLGADLASEELEASIESMLVERFTLDDALIRTLAIEQRAYRAIVTAAPDGFGSDPSSYRYDVLFPMGVSVETAMEQIVVREGIDRAWPGDGVVYFRRPSLTSPDRTKSALGRIASQPIYASVTIRNWQTTQRLRAMLEAGGG